MASTLPVVDDPNRDYGDKIVAVEPGGVEFIPLDERHGRPSQLLWTWTSPNMEFATITVGLLGPIAFGMTFWQSFLAIVVGTALGSLTQGLLSTWGPKHGLPQMVIGRSAFGFFGNILPAGLNTLVAGIGWFAVNSVSGALALHALISGLPDWLCLVIIVVLEIGIAFFGHNLIHAFEKYAFPVLAVVFVIASIIALTKVNADAKPFYSGGIGGFLIMVGATFGYAAGWNPYASDYTRYLPPDTRSAPIAVNAFAGVFFSCVLLETAGAAVFTAGHTAVDPSSFTAVVPTWLGKLTLLCIAIGAIAANALNMYSGSISAMATGLRLPTRQARATVALVLGAGGLVVAIAALHNTTNAYENFLLVISYWIGPWLGVVFVDRALIRGRDIQALLGDRRYTNWAGPIAMLVSGVLAIWLFSDQTDYIGPIAKAHPSFGDLTFEVGFVLAAVLYGVLRKVLPAEDVCARIVSEPDYRAWLAVAIEEARTGLAEGGIPIGGALIGRDGEVLGRGHNRRVQQDDPSIHGETDAFRNAGRQRSYRGTTMVTTLSPCWYCSGLVRQFGISRVVIGEARTFYGGHDWLAENGVEVVVLDDPECIAMLGDFVAANPQLWNEDIGEE